MQEGMAVVVKLVVMVDLCHLCHLLMEVLVGLYEGQQEVKLDRLLLVVVELEVRVDQMGFAAQIYFFHLLYLIQVLLT
jgi:hypothetical protein